MTKSTARQTTLVTGASGGIGLEIARVFAEKGFDLIVVARRRAELERFAEECRRKGDADVTVVPTDLLAPDAPARLFRDLAGRRVDVLVNDAGLLEKGRFSDLDPERIERLLRLNVLVLSALTRLVLPGMIDRGQGRILNVASTSAFQPVPALGLYAASKAFVLSFSESLSEELKGTGVTVTALCPGFTKTDMLDGAGVPGFLAADARAVAREGVEACIAGRAIVVPGLSNRIGASLVQFYPRWLVRTVGGFVGRWTT